MLIKGVQRTKYINLLKYRDFFGNGGKSYKGNYLVSTYFNHSKSENLLQTFQFKGKVVILKIAYDFEKIPSSFFAYSDIFTSTNYKIILKKKKKMLLHWNVRNDNLKAKY